MKPPSRKYHEKTEVERLKERIAKLEKKQPEALGIQQTIEALRSQAKRLVEERTEVINKMGELRIVADWFDVLKRSEVMVVTPEGMKYLVGQDLENYCRAEIEKQMEQRAKVWWSDPLLPSSFAQHAKDHLSKIIRDEIDKAPLHQYQLDAYKYITKGRYDPRGKS